MSGTSTGGRKPKDSLIADGFNPNKKGAMTKAALKRAEDAQRRAEKQKKADDEAIKAFAQQLSGVLKNAGATTGESAEDGKVDGEVVDQEVERTEGEDESGEIDLDSQEETRNAFRMLKDMRAAYKSVKGLQKLKTLMKDEKNFIALAKELMKIESALMQAKIRARTDNMDKQTTVYVVMKGLYDDPSVGVKVQTGGQGSVDLGKIRNMIDPNAAPAIETEEEKTDRFAAPEATW